MGRGSEHRARTKQLCWQYHCSISKEITLGNFVPVTRLMMQDVSEIYVTEMQKKNQEPPGPQNLRESKHSKRQIHANPKNVPVESGISCWFHRCLWLKFCHFLYLLIYSIAVNDKTWQILQCIISKVYKGKWQTIHMKHGFLLATGNYQ